MGDMLRWELMGFLYLQASLRSFISSFKLDKVFRASCMAILGIFFDFRQNFQKLFKILAFFGHFELL